MQKVIVAGMSFLALAGCEGRQPERANVEEMGGNVATPAPAPTLPDPTVNTAAAPVEGAIPEPYRGRWGMVVNDCDPARDDAKGLMTVEATTLSFYESRAQVTEAKADGADRVALSLAFTGEGQAWTVASTFALEDGGKTLVRIDRGEQPGTFRYARCPA